MVAPLSSANYNEMVLDRKWIHAIELLQIEIHNTFRTCLKKTKCINAEIMKS